MSTRQSDWIINDVSAESTVKIFIGKRHLTQQCGATIKKCRILRSVAEKLKEKRITAYTLERSYNAVFERKEAKREAKK